MPARIDHLRTLVSVSVSVPVPLPGSGTFVRPDGYVAPAV